MHYKDEEMSKAKESRAQKAKLSTKGLSADQALSAAGQIVDGLLARGDKSAPLTDSQIDEHPLLDDAERKICKVLRNHAKKIGESFTMLNFAANCLRAAGRDYTEASDRDDSVAAVVADARHRRAAILYAYEALKAGPAIVTETIGDRGTLRDLELLVSHGGLAS